MGKPVSVEIQLHRWMLAWAKLEARLQKAIDTGERNQETDPHYFDPRIEAFEEVLEVMEKYEPSVKRPRGADARVRD